MKIYEWFYVVAFIAFILAGESIVVEAWDYTFGFGIVALMLWFLGKSIKKDFYEN